MEADLYFFFGNRPIEYEMGKALWDTLRDRYPDARMKVQKSQVSFYNRHLFACVSLPRNRKDAIIVTFGLPYRLDSERIAQAVEPYPGRFTHHVVVESEAGLDEELLNWIREAYDFSNSKR